MAKSQNVPVEEVPVEEVVAVEEQPIEEVVDVVQVDTSTSKDHVSTVNYKFS